ncbi:MAG: cation:dicarboxylase symporter family transporter [Alphaproteobacteria bacterium]|nr:cation:dicarboxylase symporter family transporter [Alphaproteobacteria bacterium]
MKLGLWVLAALLVGIGLGAWIDDQQSPSLIQAAEAGAVLGALWLDALRMTIVPLIFAVLVSAIAQMAETAAVGPLARRALLLFAGLVILAGLYSLFATHAALTLWPISAASAESLISAAGPAPEGAGALDLGAWAQSLVPTNIVAAAAEDAVLPVVVFACVFGLAVTNLPLEQRRPLVGFFQAAAAAMIVIIQWVLVLAPVGVFGLSLSLGLTAGFETLGVLAQYVLVVSSVTLGISVVALVLGLALSGLDPVRFLRGVAPVQVIAASTQSSLASLPAMLAAAIGPLRVRPEVAEFVLPLAVAVFRMTSPVANLAVVVFLAELYGVEVSLWQWSAALVVAFAVSVSSVGLPGQTSFFASIAPICVAVGLPVTLLPLLLAVEVIPDVFRTIGNVTADLSATAILNRRGGAAAAKQELS